MKTILYFAAGTLLVAPAVMCLISNNIWIMIAGMIYGLILYKIRTIKQVRRIYRKIIKSSIRIQGRFW